MGKYDKIEPGLGTYHAVYKRDEDGVWIVHVEEVPICHTYGRSIEQARVRIREALGLFHDDAEDAEIVDDVRLGKAAAARLRRYKKARLRVELAEATMTEARALFLEASAELAAADVGTVLGVSRQRVYKLLEAANRPLEVGGSSKVEKKRKKAAKRTRRRRQKVS